VQLGARSRGSGAQAQVIDFSGPDEVPGQRAQEGRTEQELLEMDSPEAHGRK
jgi:hypothetical protein